LMTHWFSPKELATKMGIWNTSHCIGAGAVGLVCAYGLKWTNNDWRICFFVPAALALITSGLLMMYLRDTPESVGLPPVAGTSARNKRPMWDVLVQRVFRNYHIWLFCFASFFVYIVRYSVFDWGPTMLKQYKHTPLTSAALMMGGFEGAGVLGAICAGWITDRFFAGRGARTCVFCMIGCMAIIFLLWKLPPGRPWASTGLLIIAGFLVYAPQALVGISAANLATKEAAASAAGLAGFFAYASTIVSGWGIGFLVDHYGWDQAFIAMLIAAAAGTLMFIANWNAPRDGYGKPAPAA
jgi:sugar phosphate permease